MGRKTSATLQRFGIPFVGYNRFLIEPFLPFELRSSSLDRYGWDRPTPPLTSFLGKQQYRLSFQLDLLLTQILIQYLQAFHFIFLRLRIKQHRRHLALHVFYLPHYPDTIPSPKVTASSLTLEVPAWGTLSSSLLSNSLREFLQLQTPIVFIWHPVNIIEIPVTSLTQHLRKFQYLFPKKDKLLFRQGIQLLAMLPTYNCNQALALWVARALETIKRPNLLFNIIKRANNFWLQQKQPCYLKGFQLKVKGRLGGVDMATGITLSWGTLSRQTLSLGVTRGYASANTLQGLYGVRIYTHYF